MKFKKPVFSIILFTSKTLKDDKHPVMIRATFDRKRKYFSLGMAAHPDQWNEELARFQAKRLTEKQRQANHRLNDYENQLRDLQDYFTRVAFTFDKFEQKVFKAPSASVLKYFDNVIESLKESDRLGSARSYKNTRDKLNDFYGKDFAFDDVDKRFLQKFEAFICETCSPSTAGIYLRTLRAIYNRAITDNVVKRESYPFESFPIKAVKARKKALTREQLEYLKSYKAVKDSKQWHSLNLFLFSYYARGMNLTDIAGLRWRDVRNGRLFYVRQKTKDLIDLPIDEKLAAIINQYNTTDYLFPILEEGLPAITKRYRIHGKLKQINKDLKEIATAINAKLKEEGIEEGGLPTDLTFYWGRHSYATALKRGGVSTAVISETLGHSSEAVTKNYLDSFSTDQLDEINKHL